jgi:hypothetical protein
VATKQTGVVEEKAVVNASPDVAFTVITSALDLGGWLCNEARCAARPGGVYELWWNSGYTVKIEQALAGASEEKVGRTPAGTEWSAKQIIAHLCATERLQHYFIATAMVGDQVLNTPGNASASPDIVSAILAVEPTAAGLLRQLVAEEEMTLAMFTAMGPEIAANRARVWRTAAETYRLFDHIDEHVEQIKGALALAEH